MTSSSSQQQKIGTYNGFSGLNELDLFSENPFNPFNPL